MFFKSNTNNIGGIKPMASCPGISCSYSCQVPSADLGTTSQVAAYENRASVKDSGSPS